MIQGQYEGIMGALREIRDRLPGGAPASDDRGEEYRMVCLVTPDGPRQMWIDEVCESHFVKPGAGVPDGWRRVYVHRHGR